ncbi:precorrin-6A synthase [Chelatococcus caeni]|uniref:Precorrin-6A synthase [deacetylating] n=1 Tax=Chelatococcus caeni TaxID=1348468 RepID=A0A840C397_9HYPH|nr:precorrin-6A synthase (deacetylating) [Chelatococcus caeni]MBB4018482.1 precorrin-6A synthase [Chelatococcus caeni]
MQRNILVIGIGAGNPEHMTVEAIKALNRADVVFIPEKGAEKEELAALRRGICDRFIERAGVRRVSFAVPQRDASGGYRSGVEDWHEAIAGIYEALIRDALNEARTGAFLVWGDPSLYDSTLRILERVEARGALTLAIEVIPGITSIQALAASHRVVLNDIGKPVTVTTGRRLGEDFDGEGTTVVMLDGGTAFAGLDPDTHIWWGAYLGTPDEIVIAGRLGDVGEEIARTKQAARARKGWIMDTYLLKKEER